MEFRRRSPDRVDLPMASSGITFSHPAGNQGAFKARNSLAVRSVNPVQVDNPFKLPRLSNVDKFQQLNHEASGVNGRLGKGYMTPGRVIRDSRNSIVAPLGSSDFANLKNMQSI